MLYRPFTIEFLKELIQSNLIMHIYKGIKENHNVIIEKLQKQKPDPDLDYNLIGISFVEDRIFIKYKNNFYELKGYSLEDGFIYREIPYTPYENLSWLKKKYLKYKKIKIEEMKLKVSVFEKIDLEDKREKSFKKDLYVEIFNNTKIIKEQIFYRREQHFLEKDSDHLYKAKYIEFKELPKRVSDINDKDEALFLAMILERHYISMKFIDKENLLNSLDSYSHEKIGSIMDEKRKKESEELIWNGNNSGVSRMNIMEIRRLLYPPI